MAGGVRYKWQGSKVEISTSFDSTAKDITAISKANPAVVTSAAHGLADGAVVEITGVAGMTELNGRRFVVESLTTDTFALVGVDSTGYGTYTSGGDAVAGTFANFCEMTGYNRQGGTSAEIDATTICSDAAEFETGLPDFGTTQIDYNWAPAVAVQKAIEAAYASGDVIAVRVVLPKNGGTKVQLGTVQQTSEQASNGSLWTGSLTIRNSGAPAFFEAA
ncbi:MAG: phage tail protein [Variovorax sp.]|nr:phage tail protein [Variovorax sp.]